MTTDAEIALHLDLSTRWVRELRAKGALPAAGADLDANRIAYVRHLRSADGKAMRSPDGEALDTQRTRLAREQANQLAMKNAAMRRELAPPAEMKAAIVRMIQTARAALGKVPARVAGADRTLKQRLRAAIDDALVDLDAERVLPGIEHDGPDTNATA